MQVTITLDDALGAVLQEDADSRGVSLKTAIERYIEAQAQALRKAKRRDQGRELVVAYQAAAPEDQLRVQRMLGITVDEP